MSAHSTQSLDLAMNLFKSCEKNETERNDIRNAITPYSWNEKKSTGRYKQRQPLMGVLNRLIVLTANLLSI